MFVAFALNGLAAALSWGKRVMPLRVSDGLWPVESSRFFFVAVKWNAT